MKCWVKTFLVSKMMSFSHTNSIGNLKTTRNCLMVHLIIGTITLKLCWSCTALSCLKTSYSPNHSKCAQKLFKMIKKRIILVSAVKALIVTLQLNTKCCSNKSEKKLVWKHLLREQLSRKNSQGSNLPKILSGLLRKVLLKQKKAKKKKSRNKQLFLWKWLAQFQKFSWLKRMLRWKSRSTMISPRLLF